MRPTTLLLALFVSANLASAAEPVLAQQNKAAALTVAVANPAERRWPETIPASGWLKPWHEAVIAAEIDGLRVTAVLVDVGSVVSKGQPLVRLADEAVRAELRNQEAALASARADLAKATANADVGALKAWSDRGQGPEFDIVSGVSTGALIAPYAFLGSPMTRSSSTCTRSGSPRRWSMPISCPRAFSAQAS